MARGPRRRATARATATSTPFVHGGPRRATENCNGNINTFCPRRATEGHGELQRQHQHLLSTEGHGGPRRTATATSTPFVHGGPRRATENCNGNINTFCPRRATEGHGELQRQRQPPLSTEGSVGNHNWFTNGRDGITEQISVSFVREAGSLWVKFFLGKLNCTSKKGLKCRN